MSIVSEIKNKIMNGEQIEKNEAMMLADAGLEELCSAADAIRRTFCGNTFDICTIINGKSGRCSENCKYCAQAKHHATDIAKHPLLTARQIAEGARKAKEQGIPRYSIVTSGKKLNQREVEQICESVRRIKETVGIKVCASLGLLSEEDFKKLKDAGVSCIHNNLETSRNYFKEICTTHTYDDKIAAVQSAKRAGLSVCSGGIMGIGETMEDRIDLALTLRKLNIHSVPVNLLNPIPGTPLANQNILSTNEARRIVAIYRFILPDAFIRMAGGRKLLKDNGKKCFQSGANAAISGDFLTTSGVTLNQDKRMLKELGYTY